jgi:hypothetical protein
MREFRVSAIVSVACSMLLSCLSASADIIVTNFNEFTGYGTFTDSTNFVAMKFNPGNSGYDLSSLVVRTSGQANTPLTAALWSNNSGAPGSLITSFGSASRSDISTTFAISSVNVLPSTDYWLVFHYGAAGGFQDVTSNAFTGNNGATMTSPFLKSNDSGASWTPEPPSVFFSSSALQFTLEGVASAVPEPTSIALYGIGILGMGIFSARRRKR